MEIFNYTLERNPFPDNEYMKEISKDDFCFLDIETTGFSRKKDQIVLIGLLFIEDKQYKLRQYFLEDPLLEKELLKQFIHDLSKFKLMITYNGLSFDYPFIQERSEIHKLTLQLSDLKHVDLYKHIQGNKRTLPIENYKLKTVEKLLGIHRKDGISGGDSVTLYYRYLQNKKSEFRDQILLHNYEDILYLPLITGVFDYFSIKPFLINGLHHSMNLSDKKDFHQRELSFVFKFNDIALKDDKILINGSTKSMGILREINVFEEHFNFFWSPDNEQYLLELLVRSEALNSEIRVHYINYVEIIKSIKGSSDITYETGDFVYNNFIMYTNDSLNHTLALTVIPELLKKLFQQHLP